MSNLNKIKEEGEKEFNSIFYIELRGNPTREVFPCEGGYCGTSVKQIKDWHNKQIDKAYSLAIDEVVEKVNKLYETGDVTLDALIQLEELSLKNKDNG